MNSLVAALALATAAQKALAQTPLADKRFTWGQLPYQVDTDTGERGHQYGYNICNATTENQESLCQTAVINSLDDFCLWGPPEPDSLIGDTEGEAVAWCTKPGYGTRLIPEGALTGVQFIKTPDYIQVTGRINQALINIEASDSGGEMDPHGADQRGNPLGGLLFSNAYTGEFIQAVEWHNFMGGGTFCLKACDPAGPNAARYCEHIFDRIGCYYNAPADYEDGAFLSCAGESQDFPGIYTDAAGVVQTYTQPPEADGEIQTMPYQPTIPATSECTTFSSAELYANAPAATRSVSSSASGASTRANPGTKTQTRSSTSTSSAGDDEESDSAAGQLGVSAGVIGSVAAVITSFFAAAALF